MLLREMVELLRQYQQGKLTAAEVMKRLEELKKL